MNNHTIILASSSPRRIEMLYNHGIKAMIVKPEVDESLNPQIGMEDAVMFLALKKALYVEDLLEKKDLNGPSLIIAADTVVFTDRIIGKPENREEAFKILSEMNGKEHYVTTGVALLEPFGFRRRVFYETTKVFFKRYTEEDIKEYVATEEPYDKAGGYAIQGAWGRFVDRIEGDMDNVIGFPITRILKEINEL